MKIELDIDPIPAPRPRLSKFSVYNTSAYTEYKETIKLMLRKMFYGKDTWHDGAIKIDIDFYIPMPKSWSQKKKEKLINQYHLQKPDKDNFEKPISDCMEGIFFKDDCQVADGRVIKRWADMGKIIINIMEA